MVARVAGTHPERFSADAETAILERFLRRRARMRGGDEGAKISGATESTRSDATPSRPSDARILSGPRVQTAEAAEAARVRDGAAEACARGLGALVDDLRG